MDEYKSLKELYEALDPAFRVKLRLLKKKGITYISRDDIWNYLKDTRWVKASNLGIAEMVQDIINSNDIELANYFKDKRKIEGVLF